MKISTVFLVLFCLAFLNTNAQRKNLISYSFKKGEVMDVMLITTASDSKDKYERYRKTAFPVAFEYGYQPQTGFRISKLTLGTHLPKSLIFGKWKSKGKREGFLANISKRVPDFHSQRRALFPYFDLTYYEMSNDINFAINREKHNVATSFWEEDSRSFSKFFNQWKKQVEKSGGTFILQLKNGNSPTGYSYNPEVFCIVEWENKSKFEAFAKTHPLAKYESLKNVHQFVID